MGEKEKYNLELKSIVTDSFLKTVSAFANYNDGDVIFGVDDNGELVGIDNIDHECLRIENMINDSIDPRPNFSIEIDNSNDMAIIILHVKKGKDTPYYYRGKAYKRSNTATIQIDRFELRRLAIEGININYEERRASSQILTFKKLELELQGKAGIKEINLDILKTLNLYSKEGYYNVAGELLADENNVEFSGIDIIRFGKDINQILFRQNISKKSLLIQFDRTIEIFEQYYQYETIEGFNRLKKELIPKEAFREALANAIVHRVWDRNSYIQISMFADRIEMNSPGGLPEGISKEEYLHSTISVLRNPIIAGVFYRLDIIEQFGTGIARINNEYANSILKPKFDISDNNISIILPVMEDDILFLSEDATTVYNILKDETELSRAEIDKETGFNKSKTLRILNSLEEKQIIQRLGNGPGMTYRIK